MREANEDRQQAELSREDQRRVEQYKEALVKNIGHNTDDWNGYNLKGMPVAMLAAIKRDEASDKHSIDHSRPIDGVVRGGGQDGQGGIVVYQRVNQDTFNTMLISQHDLNQSEARQINSVHELNQVLRQQERQQAIEAEQRLQQQARSDQNAPSMGARSTFG